MRPTADLPPVEERPVLPSGFAAGGMSAGIKASGRPDLGIVAVTTAGPASAAATFTLNLVQAAPVRLSREHLAASGGAARAVIVTSGCANAATGPDGDDDQAAVAGALAAALGCGPAQTLCASTGLIGTRLPVDCGALRDRGARPGRAARRRRRPRGLRHGDADDRHPTQGGHDDGRAAERRRRVAPPGARLRRGQGGGHDASPHGHDDRAHPHRRGRRAGAPREPLARRRSPPRSSRPAWTATPRRTTRSSCSPRAPRTWSRLRLGEPGGGGTGRGDHRRLPLARPPAGRRRRGRHDAHHLPRHRRRRPARRARGGASGRAQQPRQGRRPRPRPELGPRRRGGRGGHAAGRHPHRPRPDHADHRAGRHGRLLGPASALRCGGGRRGHGRAGAARRGGPRPRRGDRRKPSAAT